MQATRPSDCCIHAKGGGVASLHTTHYAIGPHRVTLTDATSYDLARLLAPSFAPFEVKEDADGESLLQLHIDHQLESNALQRDSVAIPQEAAVASALEANSFQRLAFDWDDASCGITFLAPGEHLITITPSHSATTYCLRSQGSFASAHLGIPSELPQEEVRFVVNNYLMMLYAFAAAPQGMLLFHASAVVHQGKAYLFLGKSGTGKSTHSRLWLRHIQGCGLLNDDNPLVEVDKEGQQVIAYGSPWSGKTPCYRRECYPLGGLVRLEQAPVNQVKHLEKLAAFAAVMPSCSMLRPEVGVADNVMQTIHRLVRRVPVCYLRCLPNGEAAWLAAHALGAEPI